MKLRRKRKRQKPSGHSSELSWSVFRRVRRLKWLATTLVGLTGLQSSPTRAEEPPVTYLTAGEPAPFAGDLFPVSRSVRLGLEIEACKENAKRDLQLAHRTTEIELERATELFELQLSASRRALEFYGAWYRQPEFVVLMTALGMGLMGALSIFAYDALNAARF